MLQVYDMYQHNRSEFTNNNCVQYLPMTMCMRVNACERLCVCVCVRACLSARVRALCLFVYIAR